MSSEKTYIYLVNEFQHREKTGDIIRRLKKASDISGRKYRIERNQSLEDIRNLRGKYQGQEYVMTTIGGDGSIHHLVNDFADSGNVLACIPYGTGNDFYRACKEIFPDGIYEMDLIRVNDRYCINNACFGIDADIANDGHFIHNRFIPKPLRYHAGVLYHFLTYKKGRHLKIECEGERIEKNFMTVIAANNRYYGGGYKVSPDSRPDDALMEVYLVDRVGRIKMASMILSMKHAGHLKSPALRMMRTGRLKITSKEAFQGNIDGEPILADSFDIELLPARIQVEIDRKFIRCFAKG